MQKSRKISPTNLCIIRKERYFENRRKSSPLGKSGGGKESRKISRKGGDSGKAIVTLRNVDVPTEGNARQ